MLYLCCDYVLSHVLPVIHFFITVSAVLYNKFSVIFVMDSGVLYELTCAKTVLY